VKGFLLITRAATVGQQINTKGTCKVEKKLRSHSKNAEKYRSNGAERLPCSLRFVFVCVPSKTKHKLAKVEINSSIF